MLSSIGVEVKKANVVPTKKTRKSKKSVLGHKSNDVWDTRLDPR